MAEAKAESWHLNKAFSIGLIVSILSNGGATAVYAGKLEATISDHTRRISSVEISNSSVSRDLREMCERTARVETRSEDIVKSIDRLTNMLQAGKKIN